MRIASVSTSSATVVLNFDELALLQGALNEVCNGVRDLEHDGEFQARLSATREEGRLLLREIQAVREARADGL